MKALQSSGRRPAEPESDLAGEVQSLRRALRDVVAMSALPSIWVDCDLPRSLQNLTDVLRAALRALTVCVRVELPDRSEFSTTASDGLRNSSAHRWDAGELLDAIEPEATELVEIPRFNGSGPLKLLPHPLFFEGRQIGCLAACYKSDARLSPNDLLLLRVAANQIALLFQRHTDQARLRSREDHLRAIVESTPECVKLVAEDGTLLAMNEVGLRMVEADCAEQVVGKNVYDIIAPEFQSAFRAMNQRVCAGSKERLEFEIIGLKGTRRWMETHAAPIVDPASGRTVQLAVTRNVTERRNAELELRRKNKQLAAFLETAAFGLHRVGPDGIIQWANDAELQMLGYSADEYIGHHIAEFHADQPVIEDILKRLTSGERLCGYEARLKRKDGSIKNVLIDSSVLWEDGKFVHTQCFTLDVTERKNAERALRESEEQMAADLRAMTLLYEVGNECTVSKDFDRCLRRILDAAVSVTGADKGNLQLLDNESGALSIAAQRGFDKPFLEFFSGVHGHSAAACGSAMQNHRRVVVEDVTTSEIFAGMPALDVMQAAGARAVQSTPLISSAGHLLGMISTHFEQPHRPTERELRLVDLLARQAADYLERRQAEEALRQSEASLQIGLADSKLLQAISAEIVSEPDMEALYEKLVDAAASVMRSDFASMQMYYPERGDGELRLLALRGFHPEAAQTWEWVSRNSPSSCGEAMRRGKRVIGTDVEQCAFLGTDGLAAYRAAGIGSMQSTPLFSRSGELVGMLSTHWRKPHEPSERELRLFDILARLAADVIERRRAEMALAAKIEQQGAVAELGLFALAENDLQQLFDRAVAEIARTMKVEYCKVLELLPGGGSVLLRAGVGWKEGLVGQATVSTGMESQAGFTLAWSQPVVVKDLRKETRFNGPPLLHEHGVVSGLSCVIIGENGPWGVLGAHTKSSREFTQDDVSFLQSVANLLATSIQRRRAEEALRESQALLEGQKDAFQAAMKGRSLEESLEVLVRKAIEFTGGQGRAAFYITSPDGLALHHVVGMPEHYAKAVDGFPVSGESMACGLAVHTGRAVITRDVEEDSSWDAFRWLARHHNFRACWSFPVHTSESPALGTLAMYFSEPRQPTPREMELVSVIAHAATVIISRHQQTVERERAEQALRETNERLQKVLEIETVGVMFWDLTTGRLIDANSTFLDMMGYTRADVESRSLTWEKFTPPEYHEISRAEIAKFRATGRVGPYEKEYFHKDGTRRWLLFAGSSLGNDQCVEFCVDVSEQKKAEQALRESEERYRATFENAAVGIAHVGLDGRWLRINDAICAITGYAREELEGMTFADITHPDDIERDLQNARQLVAGKISRYAIEKRYIRKDGSLVWVMLTVSLMRNAAGQPLHFVSVIENIDEKKRAREILEQTVNERTASLREAVEQMEEFSYSVSHDLRGPLRAMNAYAGVLLEEYGNRLDATARGFLDKIQRSSDRMNRLTQDVLAYSRVARSKAQPESIDLDRLVRDVIHQHAILQPPAAQIEIAGSLPTVLGHETTLGQSVSNLLHNAVKFVAPGVTPQVRVRAEVKGKTVRLWFEDNGIGIKPEHQQRIFNMFERVHPEGAYEGTGIGLTIVRKAVEKMGGKAGVESSGHNGSRFWIELLSAE